jgi:ribosome recycling factor
MIDDLLKQANSKMNNSLEHLKGSLGKLRTGQASLAIVEGLKVDYYNTPTPLSQVATLAVPDSQTITIQPCDANVLKDIEKALQSSDLGLTPNNDGKMIRLNIPPMTQERRKEVAKVVKKYAEECRVAVRNVRREINDKLKAAEKNHEVSEDEGRDAHDETQKITDSHIKEIDKIAAAKEKSILEA